MARTWLITGASRGLGRALARAALEHGDRVLATARRPESVDDLAAEYGDRVRPFGLDVTDPAAAVAAVKTATVVFGGLDVVVNNAGYANSGPIEEVSDADFRAQFEANFFGTVHVTRAALPVLREQGSGTFVQISSIGGRVGGSPGMGAYQSAKHAVEGFSEVLANEVRPFGVRVMIVEPGAFRTDWQGSSMTIHPVGPAYAATVGAMNERRREADGAQPGDPARAAEVIVRVATSDDPPRRLLLGSDAVAIALSSAEDRTAEARAWSAVSAEADFPPQQPA
ncbi:oxidoreductase [Actinacidiphila acididurans]|uniref:SDR family NAD(P)-dependent oxidoreductase n=1 Tax=Actinacidiphila acididurans TaxID=2784346 RepID=A0ABS2TQM8_9ACTN|nr:oxidoreductase [Actinacidiphila acididurans]MBM9504575.1 SDR family NAD(P)-dependent oxidoreductase [Actinacidiphila acididurans]